jgi:putative hydrolase of the HAD superfamily
LKQVLVFDLDDTLFPEHAYVRSGLTAVGVWLASRHGLDGFFSRAWARFEAGTRGRLFDEALSDLGAKSLLGEVPTLVRVYRTHEPDIALHPDAAWALDHLSQTHRLGLLTDGYLETQTRKVRALGIARHFHAIVYSDAFGRANWKPSPVPYTTCATALGVPHAACTYVGDNPTKDFVTARQLGWTCIQVCRPDGQYGGPPPSEAHAAHRRIQSLHDLI